MKTILSLLWFLIIFPLTLYSQKNIELKNVSLSKDYKTGAVSNGIGLSCAKTILKINDKISESAVFLYDDEIELSFEEFKGFKKIDDFVYPALSMKIVKNNEETVYFEPNLLKDIQGTDLKPLVLFARFKAHLDYAPSDSYAIFIKIWDTKGTGVFTYKLPFIVKEAASSFLKITSSKGIHIDKIYLWDKTKKEIVKNPVLDTKDTFVIAFDKIKGLSSSEKVFPLFSMKIDNKKDHIILDKEHLLSDFEEEGVATAIVETKQISGEINFSKGSLENPYYFQAIIRDKKTNKYVKVEAELKLK